MKTVDFLRALLPDEGAYYAASWTKKEGHPQGGFFRNIPCDDINEVALQSKALSQQGKDAYFAMASFKAKKYFCERLQKDRTRTQDNALWVQCAWLDLDCGVEKAASGKGYATQRDAVVALRDFLKETALPAPTFVVSSGNGVHVYWRFTKPVQAKLWTIIALKLKALLKDMNVHADPSRTSDSASVLRPPGTLNWKDPASPKQVQVLRQGKEVRFSEWATKVKTLAQERNLPEPRTGAPRRTKNAGLGGEVQHKPSDAEKIARLCPTIGSMKESEGADQDDTLWYSCLGVLAFTQQGDAVCHEWSKGHHDYDPSACQAKIEHRRAGAGPTTCEYMRLLDGNLCGSCPQKCRSPIVLGLPDIEHAQTEVVATDTGPVESKLPPMPRGMEDDYVFDPERGLVQWVEDKEGRRFQKVICSAYPTIEYLFTDIDDEHYAHLAVRTRPGRWEECDIKASALAQGGYVLAGTLGGKAGLVARDQQGVTVYMQTWYDKIRQDNDLQIMRRQMGWQKDGSFVLGKRAYMPDGTVKACTLSKELVKYAEAHEPIGSRDTQVRLISKLYDRPFHEHFQFVLAASLGSVLLSLIHDDYIGIAISLWEPDGGQGKTTVCIAGIALWGDHKAFGQKAHANGITEYAQYVVAGIRHHLPVLVDETTDWGGKRIAEFAYRYSSGVAKIQGEAKGGIRDNSDKNWQNFMFMTGNGSLINKMDSEIGGCRPQIARVFEIEVPSDKGKVLKKLDPNNRQMVQELLENTGHVGAEFISYIVPRRDQVRAYLNRVYSQLQKEVDDSTDARFWLHTAACVIVANRIANKLGLFSWDVKHFDNYVKDRVRVLRGLSNDTIDEPSEVLSHMFNDLRPGLLVTNVWGGYNQQAGIDPNFRVPTSQEFTGRYLTKDRELFIPIRTVKQWCITRNIAYKSLQDMLEAGKWLIDKSCKKSLTVGTRLGSVGQTRCWRLRFEADLVETSNEEDVGEALNDEIAEEAT